MSISIPISEEEQQETHRPMTDNALRIRQKLWQKQGLISCSSFQARGLSHEDILPCFCTHTNLPFTCISLWQYFCSQGEGFFHLTFHMVILNFFPGVVSVTFLLSLCSGWLPSQCPAWILQATAPDLSTWCFPAWVSFYPCLFCAL